jgi:hypothetical protein
MERFPGWSGVQSKREVNGGSWGGLGGAPWVVGLWVRSMAIGPGLIHVQRTPSIVRELRRVQCSHVSSEEMLFALTQNK